MSIQSKMVLNRTENNTEVCKEGCREGRTHNSMSLISRISTFHEQYNRSDPTGWISSRRNKIYRVMRMQVSELDLHQEVCGERSGIG